LVEQTKKNNKNNQRKNKKHKKKPQKTKPNKTCRIENTKTGVGGGWGGLGFLVTNTQTLSFLHKNVITEFLFLERSCLNRAVYNSNGFSEESWGEKKKKKKI